jgi:hypothetical protein
MDYAKLLLANQLRREALLEQRRFARAQGKELKIMPTGDYTGIVYAILEELETTAGQIDAFFEKPKRN